jgi:YHS domain-containing protein
MRLRKMLVHAMPMSCIVAMLLSAVAIGQSAEKSKDDSMKTATNAKHLKPQTACPVMGEPIDKNLYVDYNGKRIYVCCANCIDKVKKNPEKYIKKLEKMGQSVESIGDGTKKENKDAKADTSMKGVNMKGMKMTGDTASKISEAGYWTCPMHPEVHQLAAGQCPICGMNLEYKKTTKGTQK